MQIYLARNGVQAGPYNLDEVNTMLSTGEVLLDDLVWHSGMSQWQRLGDLTNNQPYYQPNKAAATPSTPRAFGDNPEFRPEPKRVSVAELYGKTPAQSQPPHAGLASKTAKQATQDTLVYATIGARFLAVALNVTLFVLALMPFTQAFWALNPDPKRLQAGDVQALMAYSEELASQIPPDVAGLTSLLLLGYLLIQLLLIVVRGQSLGKLIVGIRTLDATTRSKPSFIKKLMRVLALSVIYLLAMGIPLPVNITLVLLAINYFMASNHPQKQGWHDLLFGTIVVKSSSIKNKK